MTKEETPENLVWPAKYIFLTAAGLILMISLGGAVGFGGFSQDFMNHLYEYEKYEMGRTGPIQYITLPNGEMVMYVNMAIDGKMKINETHAVVYWFQKIQLKPGATLIDAVNNLSNAEYVELREYELTNPANWVSINDTNVANYQFDVVIGETMGVDYIKSINGIEDNPGYGGSWLAYGLNGGTFEFIYTAMSKYQLSHGDNIIMVYGVATTLPADCCSGGGFQYEEYSGPS